MKPKTIVVALVITALLSLLIAPQLALAATRIVKFNVPSCG